MLLVMVLVMATVVGCDTQTTEPASSGEKEVEGQISFPERDLNGIIMWGAGGATDNVARTITPLVEKHLGKYIVLQNRTGATGAIATQYVFDQKADGYNILYGAENPQLYGVLDISKLSYDEFEAINIFGRGVAIVVVATDSKWGTLEDVLTEAKAKPGQILLGSIGPGGLPFVVSSLFKTVDDVEFNLVPFDGEGPAMTAMLGGHVDITIAGLTAAREMYRAGRVKPLAVISNEPVVGLEEIPPIGEMMPQYQPYLPWGPFYGVFVKKETPEEIKEVLREAYRKGFEDPKFQEFIVDFRAVPMGISGEEAAEFLDNWRRISAWLLYDAEGADISPETLGIERVN
ncbi:Tripartite-type tricarboxylate transporter, receptor component TctC [Anaerovirgula multivorans]|uniref:Tripartite-type tricarboxylate transporter, receptor component TctC n=2 Tax=Anaerovirgula multivorans TaxID=312168 RepID=A0A239HJN5_9FIRM|nr:Tripartite-type tricarboxylate transporter, receptor component TctC [Anaerovirgula multivorans]